MAFNLSHHYGLIVIIASHDKPRSGNKERKLGRSNGFDVVKLGGLPKLLLVSERHSDVKNLSPLPIIIIIIIIIFNAPTGGVV